MHSKRDDGGMYRPLSDAETRCERARTLTQTHEGRFTHERVAADRRMPLAVTVPESVPYFRGGVQPRRIPAEGDEMIFQERVAGTTVPQGLSVTRLESGYRAYRARLGDVNLHLAFPTKGARVIFGIDVITLKHPEFPGMRMMRRLVEFTV